TGKLIVDGDVLRVKPLKEKKGYEHYRYMIWLLLGLGIIIERKQIIPVGYVIVVGSGLILLGYLVNFFYKNQWKNRFHLHKIRSIKSEPDESGLETKVVLFFRSNTAKEIDFRTSENQHKAFVDYIEQYIT